MSFKGERRGKRGKILPLCVYVCVQKEERGAKTLIHNLEVAASTNWIKLSGKEDEDGRALLAVAF